MTPVQPFASRAPSTAWEAVRLADRPEFFFWIWCKPHHAPHELVVKLPAELAGYPSINQISLAHLLQYAGLTPAEFASVVIHSVAHDSAFGNAPIFVQPIPPVLLNGSEIHLQAVSAAPAPIPPAMPAPVGSAALAPHASAQSPVPHSSPVAGHDVLQLCNRIEADWQSIVQIERQLAQLRKQLAAAQGRVDALNRDLRPEERRNADRQDVSDWQDARRWLRDCSTKLSRYIKEHDMGVTSVAGKRQWFEDTYNQYVANRQPWDQLPAAQREFETHRKIITTLLNNMHNAQASAGQDGENRAKQVLARIRAKSSRRK